MKRRIVIAFVLILTLVASSATFATDNSTYSEKLSEELKLKQEPRLSVKTEPTQEQIKEILDFEKKVEEKYLSTQKDGLIEEMSTVSSSAKETKDFDIKSVTYDRNKADAYTDKYWKKANSNYPHFGDERGEGGDCANFVSQCLYAGGMSWVEKSTDYKSADNWWCKPGATDADNDSKVTFTWKLANGFKNHWKNRAEVHHLVTVESFLEKSDDWYQDLWRGDVIQFATSNGAAYHTAIVTGYDSSKKDLLIAYHSSYEHDPHNDLSLKTYLNLLKENYPNKRKVHVLEIKEDF